MGRGFAEKGSERISNPLAAFEAPNFTIEQVTPDIITALLNDEIRKNSEHDKQWGATHPENIKTDKKQDLEYAKIRVLMGEELDGGIITKKLLASKTNQASIIEITEALSKKIDEVIKNWDGGK